MNEEARSASAYAEEQLEAIHAMLNAGHRGIRLERHSLTLWGIAGAFLILVTPRLIRQERFPVRWQGAGVELLFLAAALGLVAVLDFRLTRRIRRSQGESLPFVQRQIGKVWLLLVGLGLLATFGMHFYGGGAMVYTLWLLLLGIGLFMHGLFSEQFLGWSGGAIILLSVCALALRLPMDAARWLAVFVFGAGMPTLGFLLPRLEARSSLVRAACFLGWMALATGGAFAAYRADRIIHRPTSPALSLHEYEREERADREQVVSLAPGTIVPILLSLHGDLFTQPEAITIPLKLTKKLDLVLVDGKLDGRFRVDGGDWRYYAYDIFMPRAELHADLNRVDGFGLRYAAEVATGR